MSEYSRSPYADYVCKGHVQKGRLLCSGNDIAFPGLFPGTAVSLGKEYRAVVCRVESSRTSLGTLCTDALCGYVSWMMVVAVGMVAC